MLCFFFKQKTAYEMRISDWSSDVCSSDLDRLVHRRQADALPPRRHALGRRRCPGGAPRRRDRHRRAHHGRRLGRLRDRGHRCRARTRAAQLQRPQGGQGPRRGGRIAGALEPGDRVVITEDAVTRGVSMLEAAEVVREVGAEPVLLLPVVDRGGTVEAMDAEHGLPLIALVTAPDIRSEEHTSELQYIMRRSYAGFGLEKKK